MLIPLFKKKINKRKRKRCIYPYQTSTKTFSDYLKIKIYYLSIIITLKKYLWGVSPQLQIKEITFFFKQQQQQKKPVKKKNAFDMHLHYVLVWKTICGLNYYKFNEKNIQDQTTKRNNSAVS